MVTDRLIKGLTIKQWFSLMSVPILILAYILLMLVEGMDMIKAAALGVVVYVVSMTIALYLAAAMNKYRNLRGEKMSFKDVETEIKNLKRDVDKLKEGSE